MNVSIQSVSLHYGSTEFTFYLLKINKKAQCNPDYLFPLHEHFYYEIYFAKNGTYQYLIDGRSVILANGEMLIIPPLAKHDGIRISGENAPNVISLDIREGDEYDGILDYCRDFLMGNAFKAFKASPELLEDADRFISLGIRTSFGGICEQKQIAAKFINDLFGKSDRSAFDVSLFHGESELVILIENLVNSPEYTVEDIAEAINYSKRHTQRLIKKMYGKSLSEIRADFGK